MLSHLHKFILRAAIAHRRAEPASTLPLREPGTEVRGPLEIKQRLSQGFQLCQWQRLDLALLLGGKGAATALQQAQGYRGGFRLLAHTVDLAVGHAFGEVVERDPSHGADVGDGAAVEPLVHASGKHVIDLA